MSNLGREFWKSDSSVHSRARSTGEGAWGRVPAFGIFFEFYHLFSLNSRFERKFCIPIPVVSLLFTRNRKYMSFFSGFFFRSFQIATGFFFPSPPVNNDPTGGSSRTVALAMGMVDLAPFRPVL